MELLKKEIGFLSKNRLYLTKNQANYAKELILSPYYYWYFEKKLPTSNKKRAKKIVPQMLSSLLPHNEFEFHLRQKQKDVYDVFAVDMKKVEENLGKMGLNYKNVSALSFAHNEFEDGSIKLLDGYIIKSENCVFEMDKNISETAVEESIEQVLVRIEKLNYKIRIGNSNLLEESMFFLEKNANAIIVLLLVFMVSFIINILTQQNIKTEYEKKSELLLSSQNYAQHQVQLKYIKDSFLEVDFEQKAFRNKLKNISMLQSNSTIFLDSFEFNNKAWSFDVKAANKDEVNRFLKPLSVSFVKQNKDLFVYESKK